MLESIDHVISEETGEPVLVLVFTEGSFSIDSPIGLDSEEAIGALSEFLILMHKVVVLDQIPEGESEMIH